MHTLALDTSTGNGSVALLAGGACLAEAVLPSQPRTAQTLAPAIQRLLADAGWQPQDVELVAVSVGPGSFTGLRVGVTTAKSFAYAVDAQVLGLDTLRVLAQQTADDSNHQPPAVELHTVLDAHRRQLFCERFRFEGTVPASLGPPQIVDAAEWLNDLNPGTLVCGDGLRRVFDRLPKHVQIARQELWIPRASVVGQLGWSDYQAGLRGDVWQLAPAYLRSSAAEEKAADKG